MLLTNRVEQTAWFAMRVTYQRELAVKEMLTERSIASFIPMRYELRTVKQRKKRELVPAIHNLIFVYAKQSDVQQVKAEISYFQYMMDRCTGRKIVIPEEQMRRFMAVAGTYNENLIYFKPGETNLAKGTRVRVIGGEFEGQEGTFVKLKGVRDRRVVIAVEGVVAVAMATIHPDLIEAIPDTPQPTVGKSIRRKIVI
ncbi:MAG: UpxY family transcription antiterminator [Prevotellaceae bacterium]|jgi:transcription antitermination factor NusG|nr:UpxY family transcription antiterminator [Prevotellaceae bacterium]